MTAVANSLLAGAAITTNTAPTAGSITRYNATAGNLAVTLPALSALPDGAIYPIEKDSLDVSVNTIVFTAAGSDTFDSGSTSVTLQLSGQSIVIGRVSVSGVAHWKILPGGSKRLNSLDARYLPGTWTPVGTFLNSCSQQSGFNVVAYRLFAGQVQFKGAVHTPSTLTANSSVVAFTLPTALRPVGVNPWIGIGGTDQGVPVQIKVQTDGSFVIAAVFGQMTSGLVAIEGLAYALGG